MVSCVGVLSLEETICLTETNNSKSSVEKKRKMRWCVHTLNSALNGSSGRGQEQWPCDLWNNSKASHREMPSCVSLYGYPCQNETNEQQTTQYSCSCVGIYWEGVSAETLSPKGEHGLTSVHQKAQLMKLLPASQCWFGHWTAWAQWWLNSKTF